MRLNVLSVLSALLVPFALTACDPAGPRDDDKKDDETPTGFELAGAWRNEFGGVEVIDEERWNDDAVVSFDSKANVAITQTSEDSEWSPGKFNRVVWTEPKDGVAYTCTIEFGLDTKEDAEASTKVADATNPAEGGCADFPWTKIERIEAIELTGTWDTEFETTEQIDSRRWDSSALVSFDNEANVAVTQNADDAEWNPGKFNKVVWTEPKDGVAYTCMVAFGQDSADAALGAEDTSDADDLDSGCAGFSWTRLTLRP